MNHHQEQPCEHFLESNLQDLGSSQSAGNHFETLNLNLCSIELINALVGLLVLFLQKFLMSFITFQFN